MAQKMEENTENAFSFLVPLFELSSKGLNLARVV
jgi:hypothetical protein